jgi:hypothetical protein
MTDVQAPVYGPLGGTSVSGTSLTVDMMVNPPTIIPQLIRDFTAENQGYFIETVLDTPAGNVQGGAVVGTETFPEDHFLDPAQDLAPRAPGAESPLIGGLRREPTIFRPSSWSGVLEVTDEAKRWNKVDEVVNNFRRASNSFADKVQTGGLNAIKAAIASWGRTASSVSWADAAALSALNATRSGEPAATLRQVITQFVNDKTGVRPDTAIFNPQELTALDEIYGERAGGAAGFLARYGITNVFETPLQTAGKAWFLKSKQVGSIRWDKPLGQEQQRGPAGTWKDVYALECAPVYVLLDAGSVLEVTGLAA